MFGVNKELLKVKGLISSIHYLKSYKIKILQIEKLIQRKQSKYEARLNPKYQAEIENLQDCYKKNVFRTIEIQNLVEKEFHLFVNQFEQILQLSVENLIRKNLELYEKSSEVLLNAKHNVIF